MDKHVFVAATNNAGKLKEIRDILAAAGFGCISMAEAGLALEPEEAGATFSANALIKARAVCAACGQPAIADDSGLCVEALGGRPGIFSARYAGEDKDSEANVNKLLAELEGLPFSRRRARFVAAVCAVFPDGKEICAHGWCEGFIGPERRGAGGFGYDPVFWQKGNHSFAELSETRKNQISHRGRALRKLMFKLVAGCRLPVARKDV